MTHADRLRLRLFAALALVDGGACDGGSSGTAPPVATKTGDAKDATPEVKPEVTPDVKPDATPGVKPDVKPDATPAVKPDATPEPEPVAKTTMDPDLVADEPPRPTCPSGTWCGVVHPPATGPDTALGCPSEVTPAVKAIAGEAPSPGGERTSFDAPLTTSTRASGTADACCYAWVRPCPGGRPLLDDGRVVSASLGAVETTVVATRTPHAEAAAAWMRDAADEYASVASFARAAIELMAVGAPPELVHACHRAALDELAHARACTEIGWSFGATPEAPVRVPAVAPRPSDLARLARDTFVEGCVGETLAALVLRTAASHCNDAELASTIASIAEDEERHAALAWRTVAWALGQGGAHVASALRDAIDETRASFADAIETPGTPRDPTPARCGRLDGSAREEVLRAGWRDVVEPLGRALLGPGNDISSAGRWGQQGPSRARCTAP